jgi:acid phosphatase
MFPTFDHVFLLVEENHSFDQVMVASAMPYLTSLAEQFGLCTQYHSPTHPSIGNYLALTCGTVLTNDDSYSGSFDVDNIARRLIGAGRRWKAYCDSLPAVGYLDSHFPYVTRHNPFSYYTDVTTDNRQHQNLVPFAPYFMQDLKADSLLDFSFIVPDILHDAHSASLGDADSWLRANVGPLISSDLLKSKGLLIITFDEGDVNDNAGGGGHVATLLISSKIVRRQSATSYSHVNTLRTIMEALGLPGPFPGGADGAQPMSEFFE